MNQSKKWTERLSALEKVIFILVQKYSTEITKLQKEIKIKTGPCKILRKILKSNAVAPIMETKKPQVNRK